MPVCGDGATGRRGDGGLTDVDEVPAEPTTIPNSRDAFSQSKMGVRGQGGRERTWAPIPSRLQQKSNAECGMANAELVSQRLRRSAN
jgi:hypothetical protein